MNKVNILSSEVIAKIAAGEIVERPASVVKELVENSIDAGADSIEVHLKDAGKELIHIKDNGHGIARDDLEQIFQRHATSKLKSIEDLEKLASMGFRGEALYSIGAVSDTVLRSKPLVIPAKAGIQNMDPRLRPSEVPGTRGKHSGMTEESAWEIHLNGGKRLELKPCALSSHGTEIKITQLFFNTPARRKFLKSSTAEMQQILNVFLPYALLYPTKRFSLSHAGRSMVDLRPASSAIDRMAAALNLGPKDLVEASQEFKELGCTVRMVLSNINVQRPRRDLQFIFVNNRPVDSKSLSFNINDVYRIILPPGVYPAFIVDIQIDPSEVDVNIHPTKREVRLRQDARLNSFVRHMTEYTLLQTGQAKEMQGLGVWGQGLEKKRKGLPADQIIFGPRQFQNNTITDYSTKYNSNPYSSSLFEQEQSPTPNPYTLSPENLHSKFSKARYIGQFINKYLLFEADQSLFMVDQHAAQERIMFEKFENQIKDGTIEVQHLLTPLLLKLSPAERIAWEESVDKLKEVGIETSLFDEDTLAIQTQPVLLKNIERALRLLLSGDDIARCDRTTIARRACKASIVTGDRLDATQVEHQRKQLLACHDPFTCPHGRPTVVELKESFLDRQFLRT